MAMSIIAIIGISAAIWREHNPVKFCDELVQENIKEYNPIACRLRYPILNAEEIQALKNENTKLKEQIMEYESQLETNEEETTGQELMQIDY